MAASPAIRPLATPSTVGFPRCIHSTTIHTNAPHLLRPLGRQEGTPSHPIRTQRTARVEPEPAEPQQARSQQRYGEVMRRHGVGAHPLRFPITMASNQAELTPDVTCTTAPPQSRCAHLPQPSPPQIQWQTG